MLAGCWFFIAWQQGLGSPASHKKSSNFKQILKVFLDR
jgi:hypothetical protein